MTSSRPIHPIRGTIVAIFITSLITLTYLLLRTAHPPLADFTPNPLTIPLAPDIPPKIWYKLPPSGLSPNTHRWTSTCLDQNPHYRHEFLTDASADAFVSHTFASRPDLVTTYLSLNIPILKADLLRYLLLYAEGGIWNDLDVSCEGVPMDLWVPRAYRDVAGLVVGWEFEVGWEGEEDDFERQFASWVIMARPGLGQVWMVVEDILDGIAEVCGRNNVSVGGLGVGMVEDVVDFTGPTRFTRSVMRSLGETMGVEVDWMGLTRLWKPRLVGDVLIFPGYAFAKDANEYSEEEEKRLGQILVTHHYAGSWKNQLGSIEGALVEGYGQEQTG
ncbi:glycosyltransferase family 32 protein [Podospora aff. communis PSN243]|uniref:Glycosyltransferase family 32 protein n=1 Tax=Podospora aff. communis PSN243 TaxID=3040156 RepID=A0AAV9G3S5_9PEZI|nr:glycosyltransferase family 32 protein [Podospora aff. communis PSN243]